MATGTAARRGEAKVTCALLLAWMVAVVVLWFGLFVGSMHPGAPGEIAIDLGGYFVPKFVYASAVLGRGALPLWNPYEFAGIPLLGAGQPAALYPPRVLLFGLLPPDLALHALFIGHYLLLGIGTFFALRVLGLRWPGGALGAIVVAFQPFMLQGHYSPPRLTNFAWVPLVLAGFVRTLERPALAPALGLSLAAACEVLAGYPEYALDTALGLAVLWPFLAVEAARDGTGKSFARGTILVVGAAVVTALVTAVQWVPLLETYGESVRAAGDFQFMFGMRRDLERFGGGLRGFVSAMTVLFYLPPLAWVSLLVGLTVPGLRYRWATAALAVLCVSAPMELLRMVPPFSMFRGPVCWFSILHLPLALHAGWGFDHLARGAGRPTWRVAGLAAVAVAPLLGYRSAAWLAIGVAALVVLRGRARAAGAVVALGTLVGCIWMWVPVDARPGTLHRYAGGQPPYPHFRDMERSGASVLEACGEDTGGRVLAPAETWRGVPVLSHLPTAQGYPEPLAPQRMSRLLAAAGLAPHSVFPIDRERLAAASGILGLLDVRCILIPDDWRPLATGLGFSPRRLLLDGRVACTRTGAGAVVVDAVERVDDAERALTAVTAPGFAFARRVVLEGEAANSGVDPAAPQGEGGAVEWVGEREPGRLRLRARAGSSSWLVVSENWYPGWRAWVDGVPTPVLRADYTLLAVAVSPGTHDVELSYTPRGFGMAVACAFAGSVLWIIAGVTTLRRGHR